MAADGSRGGLSALHEQPSWEDSEPDGQDLGVDPSDLSGETGLRPISVEPGRRLRSEATFPTEDGPRASRWYRVVSAWRKWYDEYDQSHIEFEGPEGETSRSRLENSYQPQYGKRYYGKVKDFEGGVERRWEDLTAVMLTLTASTENAHGEPRCPADHMRDIADGWGTCRKQLHQVLEGERWEYARVWEPHESGYGHLHVAVFVEADALEAERFAPVMESYVGATPPAGREAHRNRPCRGHETAESECEDCHTPVSVNSDVNNLGSYVCEYIGIFGEDPLERPMKEQAFYAVTWATRTRRVDFSNGAHELIKDEKFRRETGVRPEDRGKRNGSQDGESGAQSEGDEAGVAEVEIDPEAEEVRVGGSSGDESDEGGGEWSVRRIGTVLPENGRWEPTYAEPSVGGVETARIVGRSEADPPPEVE